MPSDKHNLITAKDMGLISHCVVNIPSPQDMPFCQSQQIVTYIVVEKEIENNGEQRLALVEP